MLALHENLPILRIKYATVLFEDFLQAIQVVDDIETIGMASAIIGVAMTVTMKW